MISTVSRSLINTIIEVTFCIYVAVSPPLTIKGGWKGLLNPKHTKDFVAPIHKDTLPPFKYVPIIRDSINVKDSIIIRYETLYTKIKVPYRTGEVEDSITFTTISSNKNNILFTWKNNNDIIRLRNDKYVILPLVHDSIIVKPYSP